MYAGAVARIEGNTAGAEADKVEPDGEAGFVGLSRTVVLELASAVELSLLVADKESDAGAALGAPRPAFKGELEAFSPRGRAACP